MQKTNKPRSEFKVLYDFGNLCGECPIWDDRRQRLLWVDSDGREIFEHDAVRHTGQVISSDLQVSSIVLDECGLVLLGRGVWLWDERGDKQRIIEQYDGEELYFNDSIAGPDGNIYAGTYYWTDHGMEKTGKLYRIGPNHRLV
jgi:sugar lactone lactonase YvrE